jgi:predicted transcriptional regulator
MTYELEEIKKIRKTLGITQTQLANRAGVSQSIIAKIESKRIDPTYTKAKKIFSALSDLEKKEEIKAEELMTKKIVGVEPESSIKDAISKMKKYQISQLPVVKNHQLIGLVSEASILDALLRSKVTRVNQIMGEAPPIISKTTSIQIISNLLHHFPIVVVATEGELMGIITKSDLLGKLYKN